MMPHRLECLVRAFARRSRSEAAFTRMEFAALMAAVAMVGMVALPTLAGFRSTGDRQWCAANFRQLTRGWLLYADDFGGRLPGNLDGGDAMAASGTNRGWAAGWLDSATPTPHNTNTALLRDAQIGPYVGSVAVYRCPSDTSLSRGRSGVPRVRSVSMNCYVGTRAAPWTLGYRQFVTLPSIVDPTPAGCLLFVDEREDSLNDPIFFIDMNSYDPDRPTQRVMVDYPTDRHEGGGTMSFVDGHVELWRWLDPRTRPPLRVGAGLPLNNPAPNSRDVARIQAAASRRVTPR